MFTTGWVVNWFCPADGESTEAGGGCWLSNYNLLKFEICAYRLLVLFAYFVT